MGLDVCKICNSEKSDTDHQFPKDHGTALQQTAGDIQNGFRGAEDPGAQDPNLTFEAQMLCSQWDVGFDFEDLRIRKEMMGRADGIFPDGYQSIQQGFRF